MGHSVVSCFQLVESSRQKKCKGLEETLFSLGLNSSRGLPWEKDKRSCDEKFYWICLFPSLPYSVIIHYSSMVSASSASKWRFLPLGLAPIFWVSLFSSLLLTLVVWKKMHIITWNGLAKQFSQNNIYQSLSGEMLMPVHLCGQARAFTWRFYSSLSWDVPCASVQCDLKYLIRS